MQHILWKNWRTLFIFNWIFEGPTLRIWLFGKSSWVSDCFKPDFDSCEAATWWLWDDDAFSLDEAGFEDNFPDLIAERTSPFSRVPWGPVAFNVDASNPYSIISNFAAGLIRAVFVFFVLTSLLVSCWVVFSFWFTELLLVEFLTASISLASSTLQKSRQHKYFIHYNAFQDKSKDFQFGKLTNKFTEHHQTFLVCILKVDARSLELKLYNVLREEVTKHFHTYCYCNRLSNCHFFWTFWCNYLSQKPSPPNVRHKLVS